MKSFLQLKHEHETLAGHSLPYYELIIQGEKIISLNDQDSSPIFTTDRSTR